jgi:hypothetical protein
VNGVTICDFSEVAEAPATTGFVRYRFHDPVNPLSAVALVVAGASELADDLGR